MTAQDIIDGARQLWNEKTAGDVMATADCLPFISQAVEKVRGRRTDSNFDDDGAEIDFTSITGVGDTVPLNERFRMACIYFLTANGYARKADLQNFKARFTEYMALFNNELVTA